MGVILDGGQEYEIVPGTLACEASCEWLRAHGLDPNCIPADSVIVRDAPGRRILYTEFVFDGDRIPSNIVVDGDEARIVGRVEQGEAPPLPLPVEVTG